MLKSKLCVWIGVLLLLLVGGCHSATPVPTPPTATPSRLAVKVSDAASACREAVAYIRQCYSEEAPGADLAWVEERVNLGGSAQFSTFRYRAQDWVVTVSCPVVKPEVTVYQVVAINQVTGFRWDGEVDSAGRVVGHALAPTPTPPVKVVTHPDWLTYVNLNHRFSFRYPSTWTLEELSGCSDDTLGNISSSVKLKQGNLNLIIGCERARQGVVIESNIGEGEWLKRGSVTVMEQEVPRLVLVNEGKEKAVYYNGTSGIKVDDLIFCVALIDSSPDFDTIDIPRDRQAEADQIVESLERVSLRYCRSGVT